MHEFYRVYVEVYVGKSKVSSYYKDVITNAIPKGEVKRYYSNEKNAPARFNDEVGKESDLYWDEKKNILLAYGHQKLANMKEKFLTVHYTYLPKRNVSINDVLNHGDVMNAMAYLIERYEGLKESFDKRRG